MLACFDLPALFKTDGYGQAMLRGLPSKLSRPAKSAELTGPMASGAKKTEPTPGKHGSQDDSLVSPISSAERMIHYLKVKSNRFFCAFSQNIAAMLTLSVPTACTSAIMQPLKTREAESKSSAATLIKSRLFRMRDDRASAADDDHRASVISAPRNSKCGELSTNRFPGGYGRRLSQKGDLPPRRPYSTYSFFSAGRLAISAAFFWYFSLVLPRTA